MCQRTTTGGWEVFSSQTADIYKDTTFPQQMWKIMVISELSFTCKPNRIPGAGVVTEQERPSVTQSNRHSTQSRIFKNNTCGFGNKHKSPAVVNAETARVVRWCGPQQFVTSLTLSPGEAVGAYTSVGSHTASSIQTAIFTNRWKTKHKPESTPRCIVHVHTVATQVWCWQQCSHWLNTKAKLAAYIHCRLQMPGCKTS